VVDVHGNDLGQRREHRSHDGGQSDPACAEHDEATTRGWACDVEDRTNTHLDTAAKGCEKRGRHIDRRRHGRARLSDRLGREGRLTVEVPVYLSGRTAVRTSAVQAGAAKEVERQPVDAVHRASCAARVAGAALGEAEYDVVTDVEVGDGCPDDFDDTRALAAEDRRQREGCRCRDDAQVCAAEACRELCEKCFGTAQGRT
jgi:hypothetical protein